MAVRELKRFASVRLTNRDHYIMALFQAEIFLSNRVIVVGLLKIAIGAQVRLMVGKNCPIGKAKRRRGGGLAPNCAVSTLS